MNFQVQNHKPITPITTEDEILALGLPGLRCTHVLLHSGTGTYLCLLSHLTRFKMRDLLAQIGDKKLKVAETNLFHNLTGSRNPSVFGLAFDRTHKINLIIDQTVTGALSVPSFVNDTHLSIQKEDLDKFLQTIGTNVRHIILNTQPTATVESTASI